MGRSAAVALPEEVSGRAQFAFVRQGLGARLRVVGLAAEVKCWGFDAHGELGLGDTEPRAPTTMGDALPPIQLEEC